MALVSTALNDPLPFAPSNLDPNLCGGGTDEQFATRTALSARLLFQFRLINQLYRRLAGYEANGQVLELRIFQTEPTSTYG